MSANTLKHTGKKVFVIDFRSFDGHLDPPVIYEATATSWGSPENIILRKGFAHQAPMIFDAPLIIIGRDGRTAKKTYIENAKGASRSKKHVKTVNWIGGEGFSYHDKIGRKRGSQIRPFAVPLICAIVGPGAQITDLRPSSAVGDIQIDQRRRKRKEKAKINPTHEFKLTLPATEIELDFEPEPTDIICHESILEAAANRFILLHGGKERYEPAEHVAGSFMYFHLLARGVA